jgi:uncharacterized protein (AIM24 family)
MNSHEVDYKIEGDDIQFLEIELDPQEVVMVESGCMMYMKADIAMETVFGGERLFLATLQGPGTNMDSVITF